ncbi:hypothetical protein ABPG72_017518 [Tetrahymena utriculariae]
MNQKFYDYYLQEEELIHYQKNNFTLLDQYQKDFNNCLIKLAEESYKYYESQNFQKKLSNFEIDLEISDKKDLKSKEIFSKNNQQLQKIKNLLKDNINLPINSKSSYSLKGCFSALVCLIEITQIQIGQVLLRIRSYKAFEEIWIETDNNLDQEYQIEHERKYKSDFIKNIQDIQDSLPKNKKNCHV